MSSDIQSTFVEAAAADTDGISTAAAVGNNGEFIINKETRQMRCAGVKRQSAKSS